jgi:hypothetical protein
MNNVGRALFSFVSLLFFAGTGAIAGPVDDYNKGMEYWNRGELAEAIPALRKAGEAGHAEAFSMLGFIHDAAEQDVEAVAYYQRAVDLGSLEGMMGLGKMLAAGEGIPMDTAAALKLYLRAADAGFGDAIRVMAQIHIRGDMGVDKNSEDARKWISLAAEQNWIVAVEALEAAYRTGDFGLQPDVTKADEFKKRLDQLKAVPESKRKRRR